MKRIRLATGIPLAMSLALSACGGDKTALDIDQLTASEVAAGVCAGSFTSVQVTEAYLARAKARSAHNAFVTLDEAGALNAARAADSRRASGAPCLPLQGVPIAVKDNIHAAGLPSTAGTPALKNF